MGAMTTVWEESFKEPGLGWAHILSETLKKRVDMAKCGVWTLPPTNKCGVWTPPLPPPHRQTEDNVGVRFF